MYAIARWICHVTANVHLENIYIYIYIYSMSNTVNENDQWKNTAAVLDWFKTIPEKNKFSFTVFDIECFYPSITENLLLNALNYAKTHTSITDHDVNIIMHCRKSLLFDNDTAWVKKTNNMFDVTMGSFDGPEICERHWPLPRRRISPFQANLRTTIRKKTKRNYKALQKPRTCDHYPKQSPHR